MWSTTRDAHIVRGGDRNVSLPAAIEQKEQRIGQFDIVYNGGTKSGLHCCTSSANIGVGNESKSVGVVVREFTFTSEPHRQTTPGTPDTGIFSTS
jgi:hypothetical protein